jgi:hypothetical protein
MAPNRCVVGKNRGVSSTDFVVPEIGGPEMDPTSAPGINLVAVDGANVVAATDGTSNSLIVVGSVDTTIGRGLGVVPVTTNPRPVVSRIKFFPFVADGGRDN